ncbi:MAG TPA: hypothetical protein VJA40_02615 [archaeon]|nr:hypothetical protein [archaeon]
MRWKTQGTKGKAKGFVTVIGFDIPSIIPIVAGLVIFFGSLSYVLLNVNAKNAELDIQRSALSIGETLRGDGLIVSGTLSNKNLNSACENAKNVRGVKFAAAVLTPQKLQAFLQGSTQTIADLRNQATGAPANAACDSGQYCDVCTYENSNASDKTNPLPARIVNIYPVIYQKTGAGTASGDQLDYRVLVVAAWK